ncbi:MAG: tRNA (adenosine(37)-N6)-dimethylallyltransferase MiaA [candidate division Zixibacteria bacterium]|nr:tRNA (adenosine(37)-N6)-dimethylallyltransferase MiaA [candidate division Zixibacteria bacterium]
MRDRVLVILGPTCVGKTQVSLKLADILKGEIVSFDSRQVYKFMDIGTAKPTKEERERVRHHLIDLVSPDEKFTAADYGKEAREIIRQIIKRNKQPIAVGGSGLYLKALIEGFFQGPKADEKIRKKLEREAQEFGEPHLFSRLKEVDSQAAERIHPNDLVRIIRALEVYELTGKPISIWQREGDYEAFPMRFVRIGLNLERKKLFQRIDLRVEWMLSGGLLNEVEKLKQKGFTPKLKALKTVGYQELFNYLEGKFDLQAAIEKIKLNTGHYAKRQLTWFRKDKEIIWLDAESENLIKEILKHFSIIQSDL